MKLGLYFVKEIIFNICGKIKINRDWKDDEIRRLLRVFYNFKFLILKL